jgi:hypothetical protein
VNLDFTAEEIAFREEVRTWLVEHAPKEPRPRAGKAMCDFDVSWLKERFAAGWGASRGLGTMAAAAYRSSNS